MDIASAEKHMLWPGSSKVFKTGVQVAIPHGYFGMIKSRSGLAIKHSIEVGAGVIDSGYRGEICVKLYNHGNTSYSINTGDRIAQLLILPVIEVEVVSCDTLPESHDDRCDNGFGSTGV